MCQWSRITTNTNTNNPELFNFVISFPNMTLNVNCIDEYASSTQKNGFYGIHAETNSLSQFLVSQYQQIVSGEIVRFENPSYFWTLCLGY